MPFDTFINNISEISEKKYNFDIIFAKNLQNFITDIRKEMNKIKDTYDNKFKK
jgi:hypothetical protein